MSGALAPSHQSTPARIPHFALPSHFLRRALLFNARSIRREDDDRLYFSFSDDGGQHRSDNIETFRDAFEVDYPLLGPGDTSADINLPTDSDGFIVIHIILSFRSEITTGSAISYLLEP